jgi:succinyl-CoA synthetase beta subunit
LVVLNLLENEAKQLLQNYGIPIPKGQVISDITQVANAINALRPPYMVKAQIAISGRGKAGGVLVANSAAEVQQAAGKLFGSTIKGATVESLLIEEKFVVKKELYVGFAVDRENRCYVMLASEMGGVNIEEVAEKTPQLVIRTPIAPLLGLRSFEALAIAKQLGYEGNQMLELSAIIQKLYWAAVETDAETAEVNPLLEMEMGFVAADARMVIDDNALFRHPEFSLKQTQAQSPAEVLASANNLAYIKLDGDIGVIGNGAGLVMATLDLLNLFGGKPANFLDIGGGASTQAIKAALKIVLEDPATKTVLVNVLGGITRCDEVAEGIVEAVQNADAHKPLAVRLVGTNEVEGQKILLKAGISAVDSMEQAAKLAVELATEAK